MLQSLTEPLKLRRTVLGEGIPKICVPLTQNNTESLLREVGEVVKRQPDLIEWRADFFEELMEFGEVEKCLSVLRDKLGQIPLIFTIRTSAEGGKRDILTEDYVNILKSVSKLGMADLIDVELFLDEKRMKELINSIHSHDCKVIASNHDFHSTPSKEELVRRMRAMDGANADVLKLAVMPENFDHVCSLLKATREMVQEDTSRPVVTISMSEKGRVSRYSGEVFGSCMTFAAVTGESAPGQEAIEDVRRALKFYHENFA